MKTILKESNQLSFSQLRITSQSALFRERFQIYYSHILIVHFLAITKRLKNNRNLKMGDLKWIARKEFETYLRVKEFLEKSNYEEFDLREKIRDRRPARIPLIIRSDDMEQRKYESIKDAANDIKVQRETLVYAYQEERRS